MIFVTVGTHEQQFNRLISYMDEYAKKHTDEKIIMQVGYSTYIPKYSKYKKMFLYDEMNFYLNNARIIITHGGPASFINVLKNGKIPIVVPRQKEFGEHINNHQLYFCKRVFQSKKNIIVVENIINLESIITNYYDLELSMKAKVDSNKENFCKKFEMVVNELM